MTGTVTATDVRTAFAAGTLPWPGSARRPLSWPAPATRWPGGSPGAVGCWRSGDGLAAADAAHVVVEFAHPVIVGKRALPAMRLADPATLSRCSREPDDIALGIAAGGDDPRVAAALAAAAGLGLLTVALVGRRPGRRRRRAGPRLAVASDDPRIVREGHVTTYHVLWELVHVFLEARVV